MINKIISFESTCEAAGKTTQAQLLQLGLQSKGISAHYYKLPSGQFRDLILDNSLDPKTHLLVQLANFSQTIQEFKPHLDNGDWVILDRWIDSTYVYQGHASGIDLSEIYKLVEFTVGPYKPARTILLDIPHAESQARIAERQEQQRIAEREGSDFQFKVRSGYLTIAETFSHRIRLVDGTGTQAEVLQRITANIQDLF